MGEGEDGNDAVRKEPGPSIILILRTNTTSEPIWYLLLLLLIDKPKGRLPDGLPTLYSKGHVNFHSTLDGATLHKGRKSESSLIV